MIPYISTTTGNYSTVTAPVYTTTSTVPFPSADCVEFGKAFDFSKLLAITDNNAITTCYAMVLDDYFKAKLENFPTWEGLPEIKVGPPVDTLQRFFQVAWYVQVPKQYVIDPSVKEEEDLWQS